MQDARSWKQLQKEQGQEHERHLQQQQRQEQERHLEQPMTNAPWSAGLLAQLRLGDCKSRDFLSKSGSTKGIALCICTVEESASPAVDEGLGPST